jgi:hypothetical protein
MKITLEDVLSTYDNRDMGRAFLSRSKLEFPLEADLKLAKLVSYLTFDGHLTKDLTNFFLSSGNDDFLRDFSSFIEDSFNRKGRIEVCKDGFGKSSKCRIFDGHLCRAALVAGAPKGNKSVTRFQIPEWITENRGFSEAYLKVAFDSEGSIWKDRNGVWRIRFKIHKAEELAEDGIHFMEQMRGMLACSGVETTCIWSIKGTKGKKCTTIGLCFGIKTKSFETFLKNVGFRIKEKKARSDSLLLGVHDVGRAGEVTVRTKS